MCNTGFNFHIVQVYTANLFWISIFGNSFCDIRCNYNIFRNNGFNFNYYWSNLQYYFLIQFYRNIFTIKISISIISESWLPYWFQYMSKPIVQYWFSITIFWIFLLKIIFDLIFKNLSCKYWFNSQNNQIHFAILNSTSMLSIPFCNIGIKFNISQLCIYVFQYISIQFAILIMLSIFTKLSSKIYFQFQFCQTKTRYQSQCWYLQYHLQHCIWLL